ncbi:MAG: YbaB/EbfC family nucleoid-associated protein [Firmicutes bacterium]|nr:YbaB/EbfC family nucleoid-associated protein [Bacillota bacterium]
MLGKLANHLQELKEQLARETATAEAGEGAVRVVINGVQEVLSVELSPSLWEGGDRERAQGLLVEAFNLALQESRRMIKEHVGKITGGLPLPI